MSNVPATMTVIEISRPGRPEVLQPATRPVPKPAPGEVLIKVAAAGVNRPDVLQRAGAYPPPPGASDLPGLEVAGEIVAVGSEVKDWRIGQKCTALTAGGGYAEYCVAPAPCCLPIPAGFDMVQAAALPETYFTVWTNVFERGRLKAGERFMVHGGTSGIGTTAIQLAHALGARVFATAGGKAKAAACESFGAERGIDYRTEDFVTVTKALTGGEGLDLILDMVGGDYIARNIAALAVEGRLVNIAFLKNPVAEINFGQVMMKRLTLTGSTLRPQSVANKGRIARALRETVWPLLEAGKVKPIIDSTFPLRDAVKAHERIDADHTGKIVLTV